MLSTSPTPSGFVAARQARGSRAACRGEQDSREEVNRTAVNGGLGPYEILSPLGAGGMGEVYRARDSRLKCDVAIKVLPPDAFARFEREAHERLADGRP